MYVRFFFFSFMPNLFLLHGCVEQSYSNDGDSLDQRDVLRSSPSRPYRHSVGFVPTHYNGTLPPSKSLCTNEVLEYISAFILMFTLSMNTLYLLHYNILSKN